MTIDYIVNVVDALVKKTGDEIPLFICEILDYKLHYIDLHQRLKAYYFYQSRINNIVIDEISTWNYFVPYWLPTS